DLADVDEHEAALHRARQRHVAAGKYERARHGRAEAVAASRVAGGLDRRIGGKDPVARIQLAERLEHGAVVRPDEGNAVAMAYTLRRGLGVFGGVDVAHADDGLAGEARVATAFQAHGDTGESLPALAGVLLHPRQAGEQLDRGLERERVAERARIAEASVVGVRACDVERERAPVVRVVARADQRVPVWQRERVRSGGRHGIGAVRPARLRARSPVAAIEGIAREPGRPALIELGIAAQGIGHTGYAVVADAHPGHRTRGPGLAVAVGTRADRQPIAHPIAVKDRVGRSGIVAAADTDVFALDAEVVAVVL